MMKIFFNIFDCTTLFAAQRCHLTVQRLYDCLRYRTQRGLLCPGYSPPPHTHTIINEVGIGEVNLFCLIRKQNKKHYCWDIISRYAEKTRGFIIIDWYWFFFFFFVIIFATIMTFFKSIFHFSGGRIGYNNLSFDIIQVNLK